MEIYVQQILNDFLIEIIKKKFPFVPMRPSSPSIAYL